MLKVNIGPMQTCVTKNPKTAQARWKIWILGNQKLGDLVQAEIISGKSFAELFEKAIDLYGKMSVRNVTKI